MSLTNKYLLLTLGLVMFCISFLTTNYLKSIILFQIVLAFITLIVFLLKKRKSDFKIKDNDNFCFKNRHCEYMKNAWQSRIFYILSAEVIIKYAFVLFIFIDFLASFTTCHYLLANRQDFLQLIDNQNIFQNEIVAFLQILSLSIMIYFQNWILNVTSESAEISARFILDISPIANMGIDADLQTNSISHEEAENKRNLLNSIGDFLENHNTIVPCGVDKIQEGDTLRVFLTSATSVTITDFLNGVVEKSLEPTTEEN